MSSLLLWIFLATAPDRLAAAPRWLEVPEAFASVGASPIVRIDGVTQLGRHPASLAYFTASESPEEVALAFLERWSRWGLPATRSASDDGVVASAYLTRERLQLAVIARRHGAVTVCFLAALALGDPEATSSTWGASLSAAEVPVIHAPVLLTVRGSLAEVLTALERAAAREGLSVNRTHVLTGATVIEHAGRARTVVTVVVPKGAEHWLWQWEEEP